MSTYAVISVSTTYEVGQSKPEANQYVFSYTISIQNISQEQIQLLSRHWLIQDGNGKTEEVYGEGVVGEQPIIQAGENYTYSSGAVLETDHGTMEGSYFMVNEDGENITVPIPKFLLSMPRTLH